MSEIMKASYVLDFYPITCAECPFHRVHNYLHRMINKINCENASLQATKIMTEKNLELLRNDDVILF